MSLPYFDLLLGRIAEGDAEVERGFGEHVHWGLWPDPAAADPTSADDYAAAAERLSLALIGMAGMRPGDRVLDVGCGFGGTLALLRRDLPGLGLTGLNIEDRQLRRAAGLARARPGAPPAFVAGDACALPFADGSFDRLLAVECIFHFPSRLAFLREARRVLRPGGSLVLSDFLLKPAIAPLGRLSALPGLRRLNLFGRCDLSATNGAYRALAAETGLVLSEIRDVTRETLPTYAFLRHLLAGQRPVPAAWLGRAVVGWLDFTSRRRLLRYGLLRFERPW